MPLLLTLTVVARLMILGTLSLARDLLIDRNLGSGDGKRPVQSARLESDLALLTIVFPCGELVHVEKLVRVDCAISFQRTL